jgi:hypothetical protein
LIRTQAINTARGLVKSSGQRLAACDIYNVSAYGSLAAKTEIEGEGKERTSEWFGKTDRERNSKAKNQPAAKRIWGLLSRWKPRPFGEWMRCV